MVGYCAQARGGGEPRREWYSRDILGMRLNLHTQSTLIPAVELESRCAVAYHFHRARRQTKTRSSTTLVGSYKEKLGNPGTKIQTTSPLVQSQVQSGKRDERYELKWESIKAREQARQRRARASCEREEKVCTSHRGGMD
jgi:hypothetical protein